jgi:hypothetical protein
MKRPPPLAAAGSAGDDPVADREPLVLMRAYAAAQDRCSRLLADQAREIARLESALVRLRAALVVRDTALGLVGEELAALRADRPDRVRRIELERLAARQRERIDRLERAFRQARPAPALSALPARPPAAGAGPRTVLRLDPSDLDCLGDALPDGQDAAAAGLAALEASLVAADLVICQSGCASHGAYWRVQDHCRRTGKPCVLVDRPEALDAVRVRRASPPAADRQPDETTGATGGPAATGAR